MITTLLIICLVFLAANITLTVVDMVHQRNNEYFELADKESTAIANQQYDDQMFQWFAALANNTAQLAKELKRIADKLEQEPALPNRPEPDPVIDTEASKAQAQIEQGIQNILNYGLEQAIKRGDGN